MNRATFIAFAWGARHAALRGAARLARVAGNSLHRALLLGGLATSSLLGGEPPIFHLLPTATVDSQGVHLHQVVAPGQPPLPGHIWLLPAPPPGQTLRLTRAELAARLSTNAPALVQGVWTGAATVVISRRLRTVGEAELAARLKAPLSRDFQCAEDELELTVTRLPAPVTIPDEPYSLRLIELPATGPSASFLLRFELRGENEGFGVWQAAVQAKVWREICVAAAPLRRGQPLEASSVARERRDILPLREVVETLPAEPARLEMVENLASGAPLTRRAVRLKPVVNRGQLIQGVVLEGSLTIALKVEALEDGAPGQWIRVRNPHSKRELRGKVHDENTIQIAL